MTMWVVCLKWKQIRMHVVHHSRKHVTIASLCMSYAFYCLCIMSCVVSRASCIMCEQSFILCIIVTTSCWLHSESHAFIVDWWWLSQDLDTCVIAHVTLAMHHHTHHVNCMRSLDSTWCMSSRIPVWEPNNWVNTRNRTWLAQKTETQWLMIACAARHSRNAHVALILLDVCTSTNSSV